LSRSAVARGAAQVLERGAQAFARGGTRCASQVLDRGAYADACGAARCFSQLHVCYAQVVAAAATLPQQEKNNSADVQRKRENFALVQR